MSPRRVSRRRDVLAGIGATTLASTAGCLDFFTNIGQPGPEQLSLGVTTLPADDDTASVQIARQLVDNLNEAGINATLDPRDDDQALRTVLLNHDFDIFVGRHPPVDDPDELRSLVHTDFTEEPGWQNPYGVTNPSLDELVDRQRRESGDERVRTVEELQHELITFQPFSVVAYPSWLTAVTDDLVADEIPRGLQSRVSYLRLERANPGHERLRVALLRTNMTENWNPLIPENVPDRGILGLIYEPLFQWIDGELVPWLAEDVSWTENGTNVTATVELRRALNWHDGEPLTTADVAFTYQFFRDTTLDDDEDQIPAPRFRGRTSLVDAVVTLSNSELSLEFANTSTEVARRALTVPVLPMHVWRDRTDRVQDYISEALDTDNPEPIGSGPFIFGDATDEQELILERNPDHFLLTLDEPHESLAPLVGPSNFDGIDFEVAANTGVALNAIDDGTIDLTASSIPPANAATVEDEFENTNVLVADGEEFFIIGFNTRRHPMQNHQFRQAVAQLVDREYLAEEAANGYADPSNTPLERTKFRTEEFVWNGASMVGEFPGEAGEIEPEAARELFREAGFRYSEDDELLTQE